MAQSRLCAISYNSYPAQPKPAQAALQHSLCACLLCPSLCRCVRAASAMSKFVAVAASRRRRAAASVGGSRGEKFSGLAMRWRFWHSEA